MEWQLRKRRVDSTTQDLNQPCSSDGEDNPFTSSDEMGKTFSACEDKYRLHEAGVSHKKRKRFSIATGEEKTTGSGEGRQRDCTSLNLSSLDERKKQRLMETLQAVESREVNIL